MSVAPDSNVQLCKHVFTTPAFRAQFVVNMFASIVACVSVESILDTCTHNSADIAIIDYIILSGSLLNVHVYSYAACTDEGKCIHVTVYTLCCV